MADATSPAPDQTPDSRSQLVTALAIVAAMAGIAGGLVFAGCRTNQWAILIGPLGTIIGALATALNAPSGIGKVIAAAMQKKPDSP